MSLTSFLKNKDVKQMFANEFPKPRIKLSGEMKAPPITTHYGLVGTAFDYLMRFFLKRHNPMARDTIWVAEVARDLIKGKGELYNLVNRNILFAKNAYSEYLKTGIVDDAILESVLYLAKIDVIYRAGIVDDNIGVIDPQDVQDLKNLISVINADEFKAKSICLLNPTFGEASRLVGGADADIIIDNQMIDIKTTKNLVVDRNKFNQIVGYYVLGRIGGVEGIDNWSSINEIGFYFSRHGIKYFYKVDEIINQQSLIRFIESFKERANKEFF